MFKIIRHILFDLGGVLLNIDYQATEDAFVQLGIQDFGKRYAQAAQIELFSKLETGAISSEEFLETLKSWCIPGTTIAQVKAAWNAMLLDFPLRRLQLLQQLQLHYDIALLSNTNEIHEAQFNKILKRTCGYDSLAVFFDKVFFSHRIGLRKPHREVYKFVLEQTGFRPEATLFIDDSAQHLPEAAALGIQTMWLKKPMTIEHDIFKPKPV